MQRIGKTAFAFALPTAAVTEVHIQVAFCIGKECPSFIDSICHLLVGGGSGIFLLHNIRSDPHGTFIRRIGASVTHLGNRCEYVYSLLVCAV